MAIGYTLSTARMQAVLIHAGAGLLQGSMGIHGALQCEVPMVVMSGETLAYGEDPDYNPGGQWISNLSVGRRTAPPGRAAGQIRDPGDEHAYAL